jgi:VCBS repeat-containing protein
MVTVSDGQAGDSESLFLTVTLVNDAPVLTSIGPQTMDEDTILSIELSASDVEDSSLVFMSVSENPMNVSAEIEGNTLILTPVLNFYGTANITVTVSDNEATDSEQIVLTVLSINDSPIANDDSYGMLQNDTLVVTVDEGLLANDTDLEDVSLTAVLVDSALHGELLLNSDGSFTYTPEEGYYGFEEFTYRAFDEELSDTAIVRIDVGNLNHEPVAD